MATTTMPHAYTQDRCRAAALSSGCFITELPRFRFLISPGFYPFGLLCHPFFHLTNPLLSLTHVTLYKYYIPDRVIVRKFTLRK